MSTPLRVALAALAMALAAGTLARAADPPPAPAVPAAPDRGWWESNAAVQIRAAGYEKKARTSYYVPMRDSVRLAVDVWLPADLAPGVKLPTILEQTRYYRSNVLRADPDGPCKPAGGPTIDLLVTRGYAYVMVDVRGSGASFGTRKSEYSDDEVRDGAQIVDWIVKQPWSDGTVGATGQSYVGTTAELLLGNAHPAVKAIMPSFSGYDFYNEIVSPGGIPNTAFTAAWAAGNRALDSGAGTPQVLGPCPVDGDDGAALLKQALAGHAGNFDLAAYLQHVQFRDDAHAGVAIDAASPYRHRAAIDAAKAAVYTVNGWYDSGYALGALRRWAGGGNQRMVLGPWNHGARFYYAPGVHAPTPSAFALGPEKLRFFDYHLKGIDAGFAAEAPVHYFTSGIDQWRSAAAWPPATTTRVLNFQAGRGLAAAAPAAGIDRYASNGQTTAGELTRWRTTMGPFPVAYPDRAGLAEQWLSYTSAPLAADTEVTGVPVVVLHVAIDQADGDCFVYLEEVTAAGQVNYVTEGALRASRRATGKLPYDGPGPAHTDRRGDALPVGPGRAMRLDIGLWPLSHVFRAGSRIRVSLAPADRGQFQDKPAEPVKWQLFRKQGMESRIELPVVAPVGAALAATGRP